MKRLRSDDLAAVVDFLGDIACLESDEAYSPALLERLRALIPCDAITYQEYEYAARRDRLLIGVEGEVAYRWDGSGPADADGEHYWRVGPCPIVNYRLRERDLEAVRMSDIISARSFRELPVYREYFRPHGLEHMLDLGLPERPPRQRSLILFRAKASRDFSERDRTLLEMLRRHLRQQETLADLRHRVAAALCGQPDRDCGVHGTALTVREREIVELVAEGKTNAEIAAQLWVAPSTVKKHLENVYVKLGVGRRAAAATLLRSAL